MNTRLPAVLSFVMLLSLCLSGCDKDEIEGSEVLTRVCPYFPDAVIYKWDRRVLWIQTKVDGVGDKTTAAMFEQACQQVKFNLGKLIKFDITQLMQLDHRFILIIGFRQYFVAWEVRNGVDGRGIPRYEVLTWQQAPSWFMEHVGSNPTPDMIQVETLQNVQNTPKGQTVQTQSLASIQAANRAKRQQELRDLLLKEKVEEDTSKY